MGFFASEAEKERSKDCMNFDLSDTSPSFIQ